MSLRSETGLQGTENVTLGCDKSAEIVNDRVVTGGISRPMATDGKGEEDSPRRTTRERLEEKSAMVLLVDEEDQIGSRSATAEHSSESEDDHDDVNPATTMVN